MAGQKVFVAKEVDSCPLEDDAVVAAVCAALERGGRPGIEVNVVFVSDQALAQMHGRWLGDDTPTDVISFDLGEEGDGPAGELYVSVDCARRQCEGDELDVRRELALYVVHGTLHLCGFEDETDEDRASMRHTENEILASLGYPQNPRPFE